MAEDIDTLFKKLGKLTHRHGLQEGALSDAAAKLQQTKAEMAQVDKEIRKLEAENA